MQSCMNLYRASAEQCSNYGLSVPMHLPISLSERKISLFFLASLLYFRTMIVWLLCVSVHFSGERFIALIKSNRPVLGAKETDD